MKTIIHGTTAGRNEHYAQGDLPVCVPCKEAWSEYKKDLLIRNKTKTGPKYYPCGTPAAYARHNRNGETPCFFCKCAHAEAELSGVYDSEYYMKHVRKVQAIEDAYYEALEANA